MITEEASSSPSNQRRSSRGRDKPQPVYNEKQLTAKASQASAGDDDEHSDQDPAPDAEAEAAASGDDSDDAVKPSPAKKPRGRPKKADPAPAASSAKKGSSKASKKQAAPEPADEEPDSSEPESEGSDLNVDDLDDLRPSKKRRGSGGGSAKLKKKAAAGAKRAPAARKKKAAPQIDAAVTDNTLFEAARGSAALAEVAREWTMHFSEDEEKAMLEVLNCILLTAGGGGGSGAYTTPGDTPIEDMSEEQWAELFDTFVRDLTGSSSKDENAADADANSDDNAEGEGGSPAKKAAAAAAAGGGGAAPQCFLLPDAPAAKAKAWKAFAANYAELWRRIGDAASVGGTRHERLLQSLFSLLITLQSAPLSEVRLAATAACMELGAGLVEARSKAEGVAARADRQKGGTVKGGAAQANKAKVLAQQAQTARAAAKLFASKIEELFISVVAHRHRDVHPAVRAYVVAGLARWALALPAAYANSDQLKYLGWGTHDTVPLVRAAAVDGLRPLYELAAKNLNDEESTLKPAMFKNFTGRFADRILAMTADKSIDVSIAALKLLRAQFATQLLDDMPQDYLEQVYRCVFDDELTAEARSVALATYIDGAEAFDDENDDLLDEDTRAAAQLTALTELIGMHAAALSEQSAEVSEVAAAVGGADLLVEAAWTQPQQRAALLQWGAALRLLGSGSSSASTGGDASADAFDEADRTALARLVSSTVAALERDTAASGTRGTRATGRVSVKEANEHLDEFAAAVLPALPSLIGAALTEPTALKLIVALPAAAARRGAAALAGKKSAVLGALKALRGVLDSSTDDAVLAAAAEGFGGLLTGDHGSEESAEAEARHLLDNIGAKVIELCPEHIDGDEPWEALSTDDEFALALALRRLRHIVGRIEPWQRVQFQDVWNAVKEAVTRRTDLDALPFPGTTYESIADDDDDYDDVIDTQANNTQSQMDNTQKSTAAKVSAAGEATATRVTILKEGTTVLVNAFMWQYSDLFRSVSEAAASRKDKADENDENDNMEEVEDENELVNSASLIAAADAAQAARDDVTHVLSAVLSMHLELQPVDAESLTDGTAAAENKQQEMEHVPRTVSRRAARALRAAQAHAYMLANNLRAPLKGTMQGVPFLRRLAWAPDAEFTSLLQAHFEAREQELEEAIAAAGDGDGSAGAEAAAAAGLLLPDGGEAVAPSVAMAYELLQPLMVGIWSNADQLNKRQAAVFVGHFIHSGPEATELVKSFITHLKARNPVHFLEVLMATLMVLYDKWVTSAKAIAAQPLEPDEADEDIEERVEAAETQGFTQWIPLAKRLSQSIGLTASALHGKMRAAFQMFMGKGVRTALEDAPRRLCFLEGLMPFVHFLTPAQRGYVIALMDEAKDNFPDEVIQEHDEVVNLLESDEADTISRQWRAFFAFRKQVEAGSGARRASTGLPKSPAARRRKSKAATTAAADKKGRRASTAAAAGSSDEESDDDYKANGRSTAKSGSTRGRGRGRGRGSRAATAASGRTTAAKRRASTASDLASVAEEHDASDSGSEHSDASAAAAAAPAAKKQKAGGSSAASKRKRGATVAPVREEGSDVDSDVNESDAPAARKRAKTAETPSETAAGSSGKKRLSAAAKAVAAQKAADAAAAAAAADNNGNNDSGDDNNSSENDEENDDDLFDDLATKPGRAKRTTRA